VKRKKRKKNKRKKKKKRKKKTGHVISIYSDLHLNTNHIIRYLKICSNLQLCFTTHMSRIVGCGTITAVTMLFWCAVKVS